MDIPATVPNYMANHPDHFRRCEARTEFCNRNGFLTCFDRYSKHPKHIAYPNTQFIVTGTYKPEAWQRIKAGEMEADRKSENLLPTAFVYECDEVPLQRQVDNIRPDAYGNILSVTYSGGKSIHVLVPIAPRFREALAKPHTIFKEVWGQTAKRLFHDPGILDGACATIGRLSRMPGVARLNRDEKDWLILDPEGCPVQECYFLNIGVEPIDIGAEIDAALEMERQEQMAREAQSVFRKYRRTGDDDDDENIESEIRHLENSNQRFPSEAKRIAIDVLVHGIIPSSKQLVGKNSYYAAYCCLKNNFGEGVTRLFVEKVKAEHPTCFPLRVDEYLR